MKSFEDLRIWQEARVFTNQIYDFTDNEREQTDESSQTEKSDAENLQPQQDKLTPLSKPIGEGGEQFIL